jgi:hypothetical protein
VFRHAILPLQPTFVTPDRMKNGATGMQTGMPYAVMTSSFREAERLQQEDPARFDQIVTEATVAEPDLAAREPLSLVAFWVYDQRVNAAPLDEGPPADPAPSAAD